MKNPKTKWRGVPIVLTSNCLPSIMYKPIDAKPGEEFYQFRNRCNNYDAFQARTKFVHMEVGYTGEEEFPYSTDDLALYMHDYVSS